MDYALHLRKSSNISLAGYYDDDWTLDPDDRCSTSGLFVYLSANLVSWQSKKQSTVSRSSTEAGYRSLAQLVAEITWIQSLLSELKINEDNKPKIWCDNLSLVMLAANPILHHIMKHINWTYILSGKKLCRKRLKCVMFLPKIRLLIFSPN